MTDSTKTAEIIGSVGKVIEEQKEYLTELDRPIGDSDHGINMARGFAAVEKKLPTVAGKDIGTILKTVGMTIVSTVGGASGPLYGTAYMKAGAAAAGKTEIGMEDFLKMLGDAIDGVKMRGHSDVEEATMLDAMVPSLNAMKEAFAAGKTTKEILDAGVKAAWAGAEHTKGLVATKGRASYVGERGLGHQDPGATSYAYTLQAIASNYC
ncbi:MAG TPA: dihydroxyacetone kinase subunit DhaL [Lachnospiraceae bacterium]|nr:dihydroxyacetone kinase subunit DhaL [Lachnospiraceae bacterium]